MYYNDTRGRGAFFLGLYAICANAAPSFPNITSSTSRNRELPQITPSAISYSTTTITGDTTSPTCASVHYAGQVCDRPGQPLYDFRQSNFLNPYLTITANASVERSRLDVCASLFDSSLTEWLNTAPITYVSTIPLKTYQESLPGTTYYYVTDVSSIPISTETVEGINWNSGTTGSGVTTLTVVSVDPAGVQIDFTFTSIASMWTGLEIHYSYIESTTQSITEQGTTYIGYTQPASTIAKFITENFAWTPVSPCCQDCTLFGSDVEVYYWPSVTPPVSTLVNSADFTFSYPSTYVAFHGLYAKDFCKTIGGIVVNATTLAFKEGELSTAPAYHWNTEDYPQSQPYLPPLYTAATWGDQICTNITQSFYQSYVAEIGLSYASYYSVQTYSTIQPQWTTWWATTEGQTFYHYTVTYNPCLPSISVPAEIFTLYPEWSTCSQGIPGLFDPPYYLMAESALLTSTTSANHPLTSFAPDAPTALPNPAAGPRISPATASQTAVSLYPTLSPSTDTPNQATQDPAASPTAVAGNPGAQSPAADPSHVPDTDPPADAPTPAVNDPPTQSENDPSAPSLSAVINDPAIPFLSPVTVDPPAQSPTINYPDPAPAVVIIGDSTITADSSSAFVIGSQTLMPGGQITYSGTVLSLDPGGTALTIGDTTTQLVSHVASASEYLVGSQTLVPGGPAVTVSGTAYSLQSDRSSVIIDGSAQPLSVPLITSEYVVASQTLIPGGPAVTISGTTYSLQSDGSSVVVNGNTEPLASLLAASTEYIIASQTLVAGGPPITVSGTEISLEPGGSSVVVGGKTEALSALLGVSTTALGGIIGTLGGFITPIKTATSSVQATGLEYNGTVFFGGASRNSERTSSSAIVALLGLVIIMAV